MIGPFYYRAAIVKGGPLVGIKIWHDYPIDPVTGETLTERPAMWRCDINGEHDDIDKIAPQFADGTGDSMRGDKIDEVTYRRFCMNREWALKHSPNDPAAKPREKVDLMTVPLPF